MVLPVVLLSILLRTAEGEAETPARRDPFVDPTTRLRPQTRPGLEGQFVGELRLVGVTRFGPDAIALLAGSDGQTYNVREGDPLWNGKVLSIDFDAARIVFLERIDPPSDDRRFRQVEKQVGE